jgi:hypothetical protein
MTKSTRTALRAERSEIQRPKLGSGRFGFALQASQAQNAVQCRKLRTGAPLS